MGRRRGPRPLAVAAGVAAVAAVLLATGIGGAGAGATSAPGAAPGAATPGTASARVRYTDVTAGAGIDFTHAHGGTGRKYYIETVVPGVCFLDYDGDGYLDAYLVQSGPLPGTPRPAGRPYSRLYRNRGDGTFEDVTERTGVANAARYGNGCTAGDYDNDGDTDLYVTNFGPSVLYRNDGGAFTDVAAAAGVANGLYALGAAFADYDNDGRLDLFAANYVDFTMDDRKFCGDVKADRRSYCHPDAYGGLPDVLFHNEGNGRFREVGKASGIGDPNGKGMGVLWFDYDDDGDLDLYVANDATPSLLYRNEGNGRFTDITLLAGVCCSEDGKPQSSMGVDAGDADGDGWPDLFVTNLSNETNQLYRNLGGKGPFSIETFPAGLGEVSLLASGWGTDFLDHDNDGDLDLVVANGHPMDDIHLVNDMLTWEQRPFFFENTGGGRYREVGSSVGPFFDRPESGRGLATGDYDNDGDLDLLFSPNNRKATLLRNDGGAAAGSWITVRLEGVRSNRDAIGAKVTLVAGGRRQSEEVRSGSSYLSQNDLRLHFGLGTAARADSIQVRWPTRPPRIEKLGPVAAGQFIVIREGQGIVRRLPPGGPWR